MTRALISLTLSLLLLSGAATRGVTRENADTDER